MISFSQTLSTRWFADECSPFALVKLVLLEVVSTDVVVVPARHVWHVAIQEVHILRFIFIAADREKELDDSPDATPAAATASGTAHSRDDADGEGGDGRRQRRRLSDNLDGTE